MGDEKGNSPDIYFVCVYFVCFISFHFHWQAVPRLPVALPVEVHDIIELTIIRPLLLAISIIMIAPVLLPEHGYLLISSAVMALA